MNLGSLEIHIFVSLVVILGAILVALICDFLKGNNEQLRELNVELRIRQEERDRLGLSQPLQWIQGLISLAKASQAAEAARPANAPANTPAAAAEPAPEPATPEDAASSVPDSEAMRRRYYDEMNARTRQTQWATREELAQLAERADRIRNRHDKTTQAADKPQDESTKPEDTAAAPQPAPRPTPAEEDARPKLIQPVFARRDAKPEPAPIEAPAPAPAVLEVPAPEPAATLEPVLAEPALAASASEPVLEPPAAEPAVHDPPAPQAAEPAPVIVASDPAPPVDQATAPTVDAFGNLNPGPPPVQPPAEPARPAPAKPPVLTGSWTSLPSTSVRVKVLPIDLNAPPNVADARPPQKRETHGAHPAEVAGVPEPAVQMQPPAASAQAAPAHADALPALYVSPTLPAAAHDAAPLVHVSVEPEAAHVEPAMQIPPGFHEGRVLAGLLNGPGAFSGVVVAIGVNDFEALRERLAESGGDAIEPIKQLIHSLLRPQDFACHTQDDEFILLYPGDGGSAVQRRLFEVSEKLWDFQLRTMGHLGVMFSWGGLEVQGERLSDAVLQARERMQQTKRGRRSTSSTSVTVRRRVVNG